MKKFLFTLLALLLTIPAFAQVVFKSSSNDTKFSLVSVGTVSNFNGIQYAVSTSGTSTPSSWSDLTSTEVTVKNGRYIWLKSKGNTTFYVDDNNYRRFKITGSASVYSGKIGTLCNGEWSFNDKSFWGAFQDCTGLTSVSALTFVTFKASSYKNMFKGCTSLKDVPNLNLNQSFAESCCEGMFEGCTSLQTPFTNANWSTFAKACFKNMFKGCVSLTQPVTFTQDLSGKSAAESCFEGMYEGCTSLESPQNLPMKTLGVACYKNMYKGCSSLKTVPMLPAETLKASCYYGMFQGCTSIEAAPELVASNLVSYCYYAMFDGCTNLNFISTRFTDWKEELNATTNWVQNVASSGVFIGEEEIVAFPIRNKSHIPAGWKVTTPNYFCMTVEGFGNGYQCTIKLTQAVTGGISTSTDGKTWTTYIPGNKLQVYANTLGQKIYVRSTATNGALSTGSSSYNQFTIDGKVSLSGNIQSLIDMTMVREDVPDYAFYNLFSSCGSNITDISELRLPATTIGTHAYDGMFKNCTLIDVAPSLPATKMSEACYKEMFYGCSSLLTPPDLNSTELAVSCYESMFYGCTSMVTGKELPATTLYNYCYKQMFYNCESMQYLAVGFKSWSPSNATENWVNGVNNVGVFCCDDGKGSNGMQNDKKDLLGLVWDYTYGSSYVPKNSSNKWAHADYPGQKYLCFMPTNSAGAKIQLAQVGTAPTVQIEYQKNNVKSSGWTTLSAGSEISLSKGNFVFLRSRKISDGNIAYNQSFYTDDNNYWHFKVSANGSGTPAVVVQGDLRSIVDNRVLPENCDNRTASVGENAFRRLFMGCDNIISAPTLPIETLGKYCYKEMFKGCSMLQTTPTLPASTLAEGCYANMFEDCSNLQFTTTLPAETMEKYAYSNMFRNCSMLTAGPDLPATVLAEYCYDGMFENTALTKAPALDAAIMRSHCYENMFKGCTSLVAAPDLPSTRLASYCYSGMFEGCSALTTHPELGASTMAEYCYQNMFKGCTSLTSAPSLSSKTLREGCYKSMFENCSAIASAPELPAVTLQKSCYERMFNGCSILTSMKVGFNAWPDQDQRSTYQWVGGVAKKGSFVCSKSLGNTEKYDSDGSYLPRDPDAKWTIVNNYLCFTNEQIKPSVVTLNYASNLASNIHLEYWSSSNVYTYDEYIALAGNSSVTQDAFNALSNAEKVKPWTDYTSGLEITLNTKGDNVFFRAKEGYTNVISNSYTSGTYSYFVIPAQYSTQSNGKTVSIPNNISVSGDLRSLISENYDMVTSFGNFAFFYLFYNCKGLVDASSLIMPEFTTTFCFGRMFQGCQHLTKAPALPAATMSSKCYSNMFLQCYSLQSAPALPSTNLADNCYLNMFQQCQELTTAPSLPATNLTTSCYESMFSGCTSLVDAPYLPAQKLAAKCYSKMFEGCTSLRSISVNFSNWTLSGLTDDNQPTYNWVSTWGGESDNPAGSFRSPDDLTSEMCAVGTYSRIPINWAKDLNIIAYIPDEDGDYPTGYTVNNSLLKHNYQFTATSEETDVLYCECPSSGTNSMRLIVPDYARVLKIRVEGTADYAGGGTVSVTQTETSTSYGSKTLNGSGSVSNVCDFTIDNQGTFDGNNLILDYTITFSKGFYGKLTLYGEAYPYCDYPQLTFDYNTNKLSMSAQSGTSIYYSTDPDYAEDASKYDATALSNGKIFKYTDEISLDSWVNEADGFDEVVYYAMAKYDNNADVKPSVVSKITIGRYSPKMAGYCLVDDGNAQSFMDAVNYAKDASSADYPVLIYVPEGEYDLSKISATTQAEVGNYVSIVGDGIDKTIIKGSGSSVMKLTGYDAYLQDLKIVHNSGASAVALEDQDVNTRKVALTGKYNYMGSETSFTSYSRSADDTQIPVNKVTLNGSTYTASLPTGKSTDAYLFQIYDNSTNELEAYALIQTSAFYVKSNLDGKTAVVRAANSNGGFGEPCTVSAQTTHGSNEVTFTDASGNTKTFSTNASGFGTFSHANAKNVRVIGASAYYAKFEMGKIRLEHINDNDVILRSEATSVATNDKRGVIIFGAPNTELHFYEDTSSPSVPENDLYANAIDDKLNDHYVSGTAEEGIWVLSGNQVCKLAKNRYIMKHRAYFDLQSSSNNGAAAMRMVFGFWNYGDDSLEEEEFAEALQEVVSEAKLVNVGNYNLLGQRTTANKGLLVKNGKVVLVK